MENKKISALSIIALILGLAIGYGAGAYRSSNMPSAGMHQMPDGSMMGNGGDMHGMMVDMNAGLRSKTGDAFDQAFLSEMIVHHEGAVEMAQAALQSAKHAEIKSMANDIIAAQTKEIAQMRAWLKSWYNK